jgi:peptidoglycan/xylan/chitin deacetylase (PgdA/CDA1 family)
MLIKKTPRFLKKMFPTIIWNSHLDQTIFSFDDGINSKMSLKFAELLKQHNKKAIFFLIGKNSTDKHLINDLSSIHELGWHSQSHKSFLKLSDVEIQQELDQRFRIEDMIEKKISYFRFPYGYFLKKHIELVEKNNLKIMMWSYKVDDYKDVKSASLENRLLGLKQNDILLYHDNSPNVDNSYLALKNYLEKKL